MQSENNVIIVNLFANFTSKTFFKPTKRLRSLPTSDDSESDSFNEGQRYSSCVAAYDHSEEPCFLNQRMNPLMPMKHAGFKRYATKCEQICQKRSYARTRTRTHTHTQF